MQNSLFGESNTAAPEADKTVSTKLAGLVARARMEARLTNVVQYVDEELLRLAFGSLRKQAAPGVDGQSYEDYAANVDEILKDLHARLTTGRYQAPVIRRVYIPKANGKLRALGITMVTSYCFNSHSLLGCNLHVPRVGDGFEAGGLDFRCVVYAQAAGRSTSRCPLTVLDPVV